MTFINNLNRILIILVLFLNFSGCTSTRPEDFKNDSLEELISKLCSKNSKTPASAIMELRARGKDVLPILVNEMNKDKYKSDLIGNQKLADQKWQCRIRIAYAIQIISGEDFFVCTSVHGWDPDTSFNMINEWWEKNKTMKHAP